MTAISAIVDDRTLTYIEETQSIEEGISILQPADDEPNAADGLTLGCGYLSPYFVTAPERMEVALENAYILLCGNRITSKQDLQPLLSQIRKSGRPLLIIAEAVEEEALATLVVNKLCGRLQVAAIRIPGGGGHRTKLLGDIALLTGGNAIAEDMHVHLRDIKLSDLGQARRITIHKDSTILEGRSGSGVPALRPQPCVRSDSSISPLQSSIYKSGNTNRAVSA